MLDEFVPIRVRADESALRSNWGQAADLYRIAKFPLMEAACNVLSGRSEAYQLICDSEIQAVRLLETPTAGVLRTASEILCFGSATPENAEVALEFARRSAVLQRDKFALEALGTALVRAKQFDESIDVFTELLSREDAVESAVVFQLSMAFLGAGKQDEANEWFEKGKAEMNVARDASGRASWAVSHWTSFNVYAKEAAQAFAKQAGQ